MKAGRLAYKILTPQQRRKTRQLVEVGEEGIHPADIYHRAIFTMKVAGLSDNPEKCL